MISIQRTPPENREAREARRQAEMAEYYRECQARAGGLDVGPNPADLEARLRKAGVPADALATLGHLTQSPALKAGSAFTRNRARMFLVLLGPTGVGKTVAAARVAQEFCRHFAWNAQPTSQRPPEPLLFVEARRLTRLPGFADESWLDELRQTHLLILDDAGDEATEFGKQALLGLLLSRYTRQRRTVLTANLTADALRARYGEALADRLRKDGEIPDLSGCRSLRERPK